MSNEKDTKQSVSTKLGRLVGTCFTACLAACLIAIMLALTIKFIAFIF